MKETDDINLIKDRYEEYKKYEKIFRKKTLLLPSFKEFEIGKSAVKYFLFLRDYIRDVLRLEREIKEIGENSEEFLEIEEEITSFYQKLENTFDDEGNIKDEASPELKEIREKKRYTYKEIEKNIKLPMQNYLKEGILRDEEIYYREGRFTLCLKTLPKNAILVSYSRSGESYFVEPEEIVNLNTKFRHLEEREREEERRIINKIYNEFVSLKNEIYQMVYCIAKLDYYGALFNFTREICGEIPEFGYEEKIYLKNAYHPVLKIKLNRKCVPYNILFDKENSVLLVTGPNGGGKTSFLEAIYLLIKMIKLSIPVPASSDSYFYIPRVIFRAGFEERSKIEEGFSSFTLYLEEIKKALENRIERKLVLLDEFMGNTDPEEGGDLGVAILKEFRDRKIKTICATHNDKIKSFLKNEKGFLVSAFTMDIKKMKPTYRLELMKMSPSYAILVAKKCGLPPSVFEKLPESAKIMEKIYSLKKEIEREKIEIKKEKEKLRKEKEEIEKEYKKKLKEKIEKFEEEIRNLIKKFEKEKKRKILKEIRKKIEEKREKEIEEVRLKQAPVVGRTYGILGTGAVGKLIGMKGEKAVLEVKGKKMEVPLSYLREVKESEEKEIEIKSYSLPLPSRVLSIRGMKKDDAEELIIRFLYDARAAGYNEVRVVHGEGKGVLKKLVFDVIKNIEFVEDFYHPPWNEGGDGVTVIKFKKI